MNENRVRVEVGGVYSRFKDDGSQVWNVVLRDGDGQDLWVYIGQFEATQLSLAMDGIVMERPQTYDATLNAFTALGAVVDEVEIAAIRNDTFYAVTRLRLDERTHGIDVRPRDALNLAARAKCPIWVQQEVFRQTLDQPKPAEATAPAVPAPALELTDSMELARMFQEDQADRQPGEGKEIDWSVVGPRDEARLARVKEVCHGNGIREPRDYYYAAMILQHGGEPEDYLLAHELCVVAASRGVEPAKWLAAASEDRFLLAIGRRQRFGTQFHKANVAAPWKLADVDDGLADGVRIALNVPALQASIARTATMNDKVGTPTPSS